MKNTYWEISEIGKLITRSHMKLISLRNLSDDSYGVTDKFLPKIVLTYNVIEVLSMEGFPIDSPRIKESLHWIKEFTKRSEDRLSGTLFRLLSHKYFTNTDELFTKDIEFLKSIIQSKKYMEQDFISKYRSFPLLVLDILTTIDSIDVNIILDLFSSIESEMDHLFTRPSDLSYIAYLCSIYMEKDKINLENLFFKSIDSLNKYQLIDGRINGNYIDTAFTLLSIGRIPKEKLLIFENFFDKMLIANDKIEETLGNFLNNNQNNYINMDEIPDEIKSIENGSLIYFLTLSIRSLLSMESDKENIIMSFMHEHLRIIYEEFYDPLCDKLKRIKRQKLSLLIIICLIPISSVILSFKYPNINIINAIAIVGSIASIASLLLSLLFRWRKN